MSTVRARVGIVGGGMLGMTLALRLREQGCDVTVLEHAPRPGGLASPERIGDVTWDRFYHVIAASDTTLGALLRELNLEHRIEWRTTKTGFFAGGDLFSLSTTLEFLRFPLLSMLQRARLALTILHASRVKEPEALERISAETWLRRWSGDATYERLWRPLLRSKLGAHHKQASAAFIWAIIARMYAARRTGMKREQFGYVDGGYATIIGALDATIRDAGVEVVCGASVRWIHDDGGGVTVALQDGGTHAFDHVVLTVPCSVITRVCPQLGEAERARLGRVVYQGIVCGSVLLKKPLAGYYVTNITDADFPFTAVIEMTALVDRERLGGHTLVYLPRYATQDDPCWQRPDEEIREEYVAGLQRMYPTLSRDDVVAFRVARAREVLAIPTLDYSRVALPALRTSMPNVFIVNSAQIVNGTLNVNETVALANAKAAELAPYLRMTAPASPAGSAR